VNFEVFGLTSEPKVRIVWAHGWGHSGVNMMPLAQTFAGRAENVLLDFPGFGRSPIPEQPWGTEDYADDAAKLLASLKPVPHTLWVGHSFGCRVGVRLGARHKGLVDAMVLIAAAGLKRKRTSLEEARFRWRRWSFQALKSIYRLTGRDPAALSGRYGSADYRNAGALRPIFVKVISEDLTDVARQVDCPVTLVFGANDGETPVEMGERYKSLMPHAELMVLDHQDHYSVLGDGRHAVAKIISDVVKTLS
jgi:pimeloyl-ACP methyl ester carboxylesterase